MIKIIAANSTQEQQLIGITDHNNANSIIPY